MAAKLKKPTEKQLRARAAALTNANTADEFAGAVAAALGSKDGSVIWVEARTLWSLVEKKTLTKEQLLEVVAKRHGERLGMAAAILRERAKS